MVKPGYRAVCRTHKNKISWFRLRKRLKPSESGLAFERSVITAGSQSQSLSLLHETDKSILG